MLQGADALVSLATEKMADCNFLLAQAAAKEGSTQSKLHSNM
jgi:hypothetical protein